MNINVIKTSQYLKNFRDHILQSAADTMAHNLKMQIKKLNTDTAGRCVGRPS